jgi:uncharacterized phage protein gp47/JayE
MATAPIIDEYGITAPDYQDVLEYLQGQYRAIFGADVYLAADSQDGQFLAIVAAAINDSNAAAIAIYNAFSPATAQGEGLSSVVKINGLSRLVASNSTVTVNIGGTVGTTINNGEVSDGTNTWALPAEVTIPSAGEISVTATAKEVGAIAAQAGTITQIATPVFGWSTVTNAAAASPGAPIETDAALRVRQSNSVALPSQTVLEGIVGAVQSVTGVTRVKAYENDTNSTDSDGLPAHSIALIVQGGDSATIAAAIANKKTPGCYLYGSTAVSVVDDFGLAQTVRYSAPTLVPISISVELDALTGYTTSISNDIKAALVAYFGAMDIGQDVIINRLFVPAQLSGAANSSKYEITALEISKKPAAVGTSDITIDFDELATLDIADITITAS